MVKIYTFSHKRPDFLELQLKSFHKNIEDDFEFIVFNNAIFDHDKKNYIDIQGFCKTNNIKCIDIEKDEILINEIYNYQNNNGPEKVFNNENLYTNSGIACAYPLCFAWKHYISKTDDLVCIIDSDMFFIDKENIGKLLNEFDLLFVAQSRIGENIKIEYMWNGISYLNLSTLPQKETLNWWCGECEGVSGDVGAHTHYYLSENQNLIKIKHLSIMSVKYDDSCDFTPANYEYIGVGENKNILHYRSGSNWDQKSDDYHHKKTIWLKKILNEK